MAHSLPDGWREVKLSDAVTIRQGRYISDTLISETQTDERRCAVYGGNGIRGFTTECALNKPTTVVTCRGSGCGRVQLTVPNAIVTNSCITLQPREMDSAYVYYWALNTGFADVTTGSAQPQITIGAMSTKEMAVPPATEQRSIASILTSLDDKIELLRKQNETLEQIARTLFDEWFVKFNFPDKDGKPYRASGGKMVDSELGGIPAGWRVGVFGELAEVSTGKGLPKSQLAPQGKYPVMGANGVIGRTNEFLLDDDVIVTGRVGTLGVVNISRGKVWLSDNVLVSTPKSWFYFTFLTLRKSNLKVLNRGSTQPLVTQTDVKAIKVVMPSPDVAADFEELTQIQYRKVFMNDSQIDVLSSIRDALLPKLMSGEIRVPKHEENA